MKFFELLYSLVVGSHSSFFYGTVGILIAMVSFIISRKSKRPVYNVSKEYTLAVVGNETAHLKILWDDKPVSSVRSITITFWNKGNLSIRVKDISITNPLTIKCTRRNVEILAYKIIKTSRPEIIFNAVKDEGDQKILVSFANDEALNKNDGFEIKLMYSSTDEVEKFWQLTGSIFDTKHSIKYIGKMYDTIYMLFIYIIFAIVIVCIFMGVFIDKGILWRTILLFLSIIFIIGLILFGNKINRYSVPKWGSWGYQAPKR